MRSFVSASLCLIIFLISSCTTKDESLKEKDFAIDTALVQKKEIFSKYQFSFNPPVRWERLPKEVFDELKEKLKKNYPREKGVIYNPVDLFYNSENKCMLYITSVGFMSVKSDPFGEYDGILKGVLNGTDIEYDKYIKDEFIIMQYIIHGSDRVNYKVVFQSARNSLVQFDYILPAAVYETELKAVQSSLGGLALMD